MKPELRQTYGKVPAKHFVQTSIAAHELWAQLCMTNKRASQCLHILTSKIDTNNAVVISHKNLAALMGVKSVNTVKKALSDLEKHNWIDIVQVAGKGSANAYVINSNVVWGEKRNGIRHALFSANIIASSEDQAKPVEDMNSAVIPDADVHNSTIPLPYSDEEQLPTGEGLPPVSQPSFESLIPSLPTVPRKPDRKSETKALEDGTTYDSDTGVLLDHESE